MNFLSSHLLSNLRVLAFLAAFSLAAAILHGQSIAPELQVESDWADNRWNEMDAGPFLASNLDAPGGRILKGLSIKIGPNDEAAVCFDTRDGILRAGWIGGFLRMDPMRYGLIHAPKIAGDPVFSFLSKQAKGIDGYQYSGMHLKGDRVVLDYRVNGRRVLESPWLLERNDLKVIARSFEIEAHERAIALIIAAGDSHMLDSANKLLSFAIPDRPKECLAVAAIGRDVNLIMQNGQALLKIPSSANRRRFNVLYWSGEKTRLPRFETIAAARRDLDVEDLTAWTQPGPPRWLPELETTGRRESDPGLFAVDTLTVPYENPWNALMFLAGVDFTTDGAAYACTIHGDVWRVTGIDEDLKALKWKRFATGLFQPLGLQVRDDQVFVLGRDQITRLHDSNQDGEADYYENFCNLIETLPGHNYVTSLEMDEAGNFYFVDSRGAHRVSRDGARLETIATGFRNPNGLGVSPDGRVITVAPQQGTWTPSSMICEIKDGGYYGFGGPKAASGRPLGYDPPLCWIPHRVDNSSGSQVWVPAGHWGPFAGRMLHLLWGRCGMMLALRDVVEGTSQGAVVPLPVRFLSGPNRGSFNPTDGHLYIAASTGWQTSAARDGALQRVRYTGKPMNMPVGWRARANGITLTFAHALDRETAEDTGSYALQQWNYRYSSEYGSKDWSIADPEKEGRDDVSLSSATLLPDGKSVFLELPGLKPVMQMEIQYNISSREGKRMRGEMWLTLNRLGERKD